MQVSVETMIGLERKLTISVPAVKIEEPVQSKIIELGKTQRLNGFRPGKVPKSVIKNKFGAQVRNEIVSDIIQRSFYEAVVQEKLQPAGAPQIEPLVMEAGKDLEFVATFDVYPEIVLKEFSELSIEKLSADVSDDDLNKMIETLQDQQAEWSDVDRKATNGDKVVINFSGTIEGEVFAGGTAENFELELGSNQMIPGFEEQLLGSEAEQEIEIQVIFPENYQNKEVAGKEAIFTTKVNLVKEKLPLSLEALAEKLSIDDTSVATMQADIRKNMERELSQVLNSKVKEQVMDALVNAHEFDIPKPLLNQEIDSLRKQALERLGGSASSIPDLPSEIFEEKASRRVKLGLVVAEVIKENKLKAEKEQVQSKLEELAAVYEDPEEVINYYLSDENRLNEVEQLVLEDNVIEFIADRAQVTSKQVSFDEVMNPKPDDASKD